MAVHHSGHGGHEQASDTPDGAQWPSIAAAVDGLLAAFDTDHSADVTLAEIAGVIDPGGHHPEVMNTVVRHLVSLVDANGDGTLTTAELTAAVTHLDGNGDGKLSPADLGADAAHDGLTPLLAVLLRGDSVPGGGGSHAPTPEPPEPAEPPEAAGPKAATVAQVVEVLTLRFDGNGDGALRLAELLATVDSAGRHAKLDDALAG